MNQTEKIPTKTVHPKILYYGTPVILLNTLNEDDTVNISPISSSWALGNHVVLGIGSGGKALENLERHAECVINIPGQNLWENVERLASFTGKNPVPDYKKEIGFTFKKEKYEVSGLTPVESVKVRPTRVMECPLQMEAIVTNVRYPDQNHSFAIVETTVVHIHAHEEITDGDYIIPNKWSPLIYNFRHYFGIGEELGKTFRSDT